HPDARIRDDTRGRDGRVRQELARGVAGKSERLIGALVAANQRKAKTNTRKQGKSDQLPKAWRHYPHRLRIEYSPRPAPKEGTVIGDGAGTGHLHRVRGGYGADDQLTNAALCPWFDAELF